MTNPTLLFNSTAVAAAYQPASMPPRAWAGPVIVAALLVALLFATTTDKRIFYWTVVRIVAALARVLTAGAGRVTGDPLPMRLVLRSVARARVGA